MSHPVHKLEQTLLFWESSCAHLQMRERWRAATEKRPLVIGGPMKHYPEFRQHLLEAADPKKILDRSRFEYSVSTQLGRDMGAGRELPRDLWMWCRSSRRVFRLERDLQLLLGQTSLDGISWDKIPWPFESFVLTFDEPCIGAEGHAYDCLLFCIEKRLLDGRLVSMANFLLLDRNLDGFKPLRQGDFLKWEGWMKKGLYKKALNFGREQQLVSRDIFFPRYLIPLELVAGTAVSDSATATANRAFNSSFMEGARPEWDYMVRLAAGFSLYLASLPPVSSHRSDWSPLSKSQRLDPRAITNAAQVCEVSSVYRMSVEERQVADEHAASRKPSYELCAHFRRGHWRRPPGKGEDPTAAKTIWVRPTLVRRDRLQPGTLPGGNETIVG